MSEILYLALPSQEKELTESAALLELHRSGLAALIQ